MAILLVILIIALATATFIENDFGAKIAQQNIYHTIWLQLIFILLSINLIGRTIILKLYKRKKLSILLFHLSFVVIIIGAGITHYFGYEGSMHIREGEASSTISTQQKTLSVQIIDSNKIASTYTFDDNIEQKPHFNEKISINDQKINVELVKFYHSAYQQAIETKNGKPVIGFILAGNDFKASEYLRDGEMKKYGQLIIGFNNSNQADINIISKNDSLFITSPYSISTSNMEQQATIVEHNEKLQLATQQLYKIKDYNLVLKEFLSSAKIIAVPSMSEDPSSGTKAMIFTISDDNKSEEITLWENSWDNQIKSIQLGKVMAGIGYGNRTIELPFSLHLDNFVIERYPGSMSPSSFSSYVKLLEEGQPATPFHIYMNNILKHHGYRFYQSSYDQDEKGTILTVNHDQWGTAVTYLGYLLLLIGIILSIINSNTFLRNTIIKSPSIFVLLITLNGVALAQDPATSQTKRNTISPEYAQDFGRLLIQNNKGRTEPVYTYASELMRKISRKERMFRLSPVQLFIEMNSNPSDWLSAPIIRVTNKELQQKLGLTGKYAAYNNFVDEHKGYVLQQMVQMIYSKSPAQRSKLDKAIIKTDEKVNICYAIFTGSYMKIFPIQDSTQNTTWYTSSDARLLAQNPTDSMFVSSILPAYFNAIDQAKVSGNYSTASEYLDGLIKYQRSNAAYQLPSETRISIEMAYYKYNPFKKLFPFYFLFGLLFLFLLIVYIAIGKELPKLIIKPFYWIIFAGFLIHTLSISARWYISGHAPMSNGYESMVFISWVTLLAGFIFNKRSPFALTATAVLGGLTLMVANLSFMDPQITNLVPVLQSYWLTIHVSVITASYGFLGLGALLGIINLLLMILRSDKNQNRLLETIESLTIINHKTLIIGLYLLTIGTFLGAVWANESWGRYWGWDPKETWALISILVYTLVTHARLIPGMKGLFTFNALSLYGFSSILMTYFGVNYYLSGLHSYAGGDPVPVPSFVYYTLAAIILLTLAASLGYDKFSKTEKQE
jgi:cytochrome c-type biogenesis protein CcsB